MGTSEILPIWPSTDRSEWKESESISCMEEGGPSYTGWAEEKQGQDKVAQSSSLQHSSITR